MALLLGLQLGLLRSKSFVCAVHIKPSDPSQTWQPIVQSGFMFHALPSQTKPQFEQVFHPKQKFVSTQPRSWMKLATADPAGLHLVRRAIPIESHLLPPMEAPEKMDNEKKLRCGMCKPQKQNQVEKIS